VDTIANVAQGGGQAFTWMMIFAVVFFAPQALLFAELGSGLPAGGRPVLLDQAGLRAPGRGGQQLPCTGSPTRCVSVVR
jgi:hypothetical protein